MSRVETVRIAAPPRPPLTEADLRVRFYHLAQRQQSIDVLVEVLAQDRATLRQQARDAGLVKALDRLENPPAPPAPEPPEPVVRARVLETISHGSHRGKVFAATKGSITEWPEGFVQALERGGFVERVPDATPLHVAPVRTWSW